MDRENIEKIVKEVLEKELDLYLARYTAGKEEEYNRLAILHRLIPLEEELKAQRELLQSLYRFLEARFETADKHLEDRFAATDKRFEATNERFQIVLQQL